MTLWRLWMVGQIEATLVAAALLGIATVFRHRLAPGFRSALLMIGLVRLAVPPLVRSPWSEAVAGVPPIDDTRLVAAGALQADAAAYVAAVMLAVTVACLARVAWALVRAERAGRGTGINIQISETAEGPMALGLRRRTIVIPRSLLALDRRALEAAIAHERAHHERRDLWWMAAASLLAAVAWFNPLAHALNRALVASREDGCDDWAVARTSNDPFAYAQALLQSARMLTARPPIGVAGAHPMGARLRRLLDAGASRERRLGWWAWLVIVIVAAAALPGAHMPSRSDGIIRTVIVVRQ